MKRVISVIMILSMVVILAACGSKASSSGDNKDDNSLKEIQDKGVLVLGCDDEFPPMGFDENGEIVGFDIDLASAVCEKLGVELEAKPIDWDAKELELKSGNIDVIWNGYSIIADRLDKVQFTKPYLNNEQMIAVRADSDITSLDDLQDKVIGVQVNSAAEDLVNEDRDFYDSLKEVRVYDTYQDALNDLKSSNRIDAVAVDKVLIEYIMQQTPDEFKLLDDALGTEYFGIGCREGSLALANAIDDALDELQESGAIDDICAKWFDSNIVIRDVDRLTKEDLEGDK